MNPERLYLDTSVASALLDSRWPDRMAVTQSFWSETLPGFRVYISEVVFKEATKTPDLARRQEILSSLRDLRLLTLSPPVEVMAQAFITNDLVPARKVEDALHLALAVHHGMDYLVSWNFDHMVRAQTKRRLPILAAQLGYFKHPIIASPQEF